jgi:hypothetical protein
MATQMEAEGNTDNSTTGEEEAADNEQLELQNADRAPGKRTSLETCNELMEEWEQCARATDHDKRRLEVIRKTPYLKKKFKKEVETIENFVKRLEEAVRATVTTSQAFWIARRSL